MQLSKFTNNDFFFESIKFKYAIWYVVNAILFNSYLLPFYKPKKIILILFGAKVGSGVIIKPKVNIKYPWKLTIGNDVWIGEGVWIDNLTDVIIEDNVCVSQGALLLTGNHDYKKESFDLMMKPIHIQSQVWIGAKSTVCPGVICEKGSVLSVGSVITEKMSGNYIYQGVPASKKRLRY